MKRCGRCRRLQPWEAFGPNRRSSDGHQSWCRRCMSAHNRRYYAANREQRLAYGRRYRQERRAT